MSESGTHPSVNIRDSGITQVGVTGKRKFFSPDGLDNAEPVTTAELEVVTIRASSILTRLLDTPEIQIHTSSRRPGTCMLASAYTITLPSLLAYPQTRVPAPSVPGPCADATAPVPQPMARLVSKAFLAPQVHEPRPLAIISRSQISRPRNVQCHL